MATETKTQVELTVNGQKIAAAADETILDAVRRLALDDIPTLCHDPRLEPYGSCFLCVVEVKGMPRLVPACVTRVREGMEVATRNPRIVASRKTALELLLTDHYADCLCPAKNACPAGVDVQGYMSLASRGYYKEALDLIRENNPLPMTCGRVCVRKCEVKCLRQQVDEPVGINFIKRYVSEQGGPALAKPAGVKDSGKRVAVVGGGPGGLTCAYYLTLRGHAVTVFESLPKLGGMLRYGIPEYRLPRKELDDEIQGILDLGVKVELGKALGKDFTIESLKSKDGFDAVFVALGAPLGKKMGLKDEDAVEGVSPALDFLRDCDLHGAPKLQGKVAVVGGGNSAIDAARTSLRCGAEEVSIIYRRTRKEMPAHHEEIDAAEKEGVKLELLAAPLELLQEGGKLTGIRCQRMELGEPDASGRRKPVPIPGAVADIPCSYVFAAIGQDTDLTALDKEPEGGKPAATKWSTIVADEDTMATGVKGVFAGGDVVLGPSAVIDAIAHGRTAAIAIDQYLSGGEVTGDKREFKSSREFFGKLPEGTFADVEKLERNLMPERAAAERVRDFVQVETGLDEPHTLSEAERCMECGCKSVFECDLKRYAGEYGVDLARLAGEVRRHKADKSHPLISLDPNKCVLCGRCIRTCAEVVGMGVLGFVGRGFATVVSPVIGKSLGESDCIACGSCVESCPTGALEARLPYGKQGPWKTEAKPSVCTFCSVGCELSLNVAAEGLFWASAAPVDKGAASDRGLLCAKGRFGTGLLQGEERLRTPLVRKGGELVEASWDEAIQAAAAALQDAVKAHGADAVGVLAAPRMTLEEAWLLRQLADALGVKAVGSFGRNRRGGPRRDLDEILGDTASTCKLEDLADADLILLAGADPAKANPVLGMAVRRARKRGAELVVVSSWPNDLAKPGDLWIDARRGTAGTVYAAALALALQPGRQDLPGADALKASVASLTPAKAAEAAGVAPDKIEALAAKLAAARKAVAVYDLDDAVERSTDDLKGLAQLLAVTDHIGKPGAGLLLARADSGGVAAKLAGIDGAAPLERLRAALVLFENPLADGQEGGVPAFQPLVAVDHFLTETAQRAEVVLPAATLAESSGTVVGFDGRTVGVEAAAAPLAGLGNAEILAKLAAALGKAGLDAAPEAVRKGLAASLGLNAAELEKARAEKGRWPVAPAAVKTLAGLNVDTAAPVADVFPYASMDAFFARKAAR